MVEHDTLAAGRAAYDRRAWTDAFDALSVADRDAGLGTDDLERLAVAAHMSGRDAEATGALERLHRTLLDAGEVGRAVRWALWLAVILLLRGEHGQGGGWLSRAARLLDAHDLDVPERAFLMVPEAFQALEAGDGPAARDLFEQVTATATRFGDIDLTVMGILGQGQALVAMGDADRGTAMLDEAMVAVTTGDVSPMMTGIAYCALILACRAVFDLRRAQEWTAALTRWCDEQEGLQPYRGQCLVHRSEIMQLRGEWTEALAEVERACDHLATGGHDPAMGMARYQQAELLRLRGDLSRAERCYREASEWGHPAHPGLALLRLAQGRTDDAQAAIRREVEAADGDRLERAKLLAAYVQIVLAAGDVEAADGGVGELTRIASDFDSAYLAAAAAEARGALLLARGDPTAATTSLRSAVVAWTELGAPYEAARARVLAARACRQLGDHDTAELELGAARRVFERLRAAPALAEVAELASVSADGAPGGLTPREVEVLRLVATGVTNREVAETLVISEKTVARHLSNIFTKLDLGSRTAAAAWAYEHGLA